MPQQTKGELEGRGVDAVARGEGVLRMNALTLVVGAAAYVLPSVPVAPCSLLLLRSSATNRSPSWSIVACDWEHEDYVEAEEAYERWKALGLLDGEASSPEAKMLPRRQGQYSEDPDPEDDTTPQMMVVSIRQTAASAYPCDAPHR